MSAVRVLGIGSPFGDDQAGWLAVRALEASGAAAGVPGVSLHVLDRPGAGLVERLLDAERVVIVDAARSGAAAGSVCRIEDEALLAREAPLSSHGLGVGAALALARAMGCRAHVVLYAIEIEAPVPGAAPGAAVRAAASAVAAQVAEEIRLRAGERTVGAEPSGRR
jgi:hydrogenase maturation protease